MIKSKENGYICKTMAMRYLMKEQKEPSRADIPRFASGFELATQVK